VTSGIATKYLSTPKLSKVTSGKSGVSISYSKVTGATGYSIYRKTGNGGWVKLTTVKGNNKTTYLDKTAEKGITYTYTVRAVNDKYMSSYNAKGITVKDRY
jgi:transcriptional regulator CtsR